MLKLGLEVDGLNPLPRRYKNYLSFLEQPEEKSRENVISVPSETWMLFSFQSSREWSGPPRTFESNGEIRNA